jgi:hypothetical protein
VFVALLTLGVPYAYLWALWVALVDFLPVIGGALAGIPTVLFAAAHSLMAGLVVLVVFVIYTLVENHLLNPLIMSRTVRISPLLVLVSILVGAPIGGWIGGLFGGFAAGLLAIPAAGAIQAIVRETWMTNGPADICEWRNGQGITVPGDDPVYDRWFTDHNATSAFQRQDFYPYGIAADPVGAAARLTTCAPDSPSPQLPKEPGRKAAPRKRQRRVIRPLSITTRTEWVISTDAESVTLWPCLRPSPSAAWTVARPGLGRRWWRRHGRCSPRVTRPK